MSRVTRKAVGAAVGLVCLLGMFVALRVIQAQSGDTLTLGQTFEGALEPGKAANWQLPAYARDMIVLSFARTSGDILPQLLVYSPEGDPIGGAMSDSAGADRLNATVRIPATGTYRVELFGQDDTAGGYTLRAELLARAATPTPAPTAVEEVVAGVINFGQTVEGTITSDIFRQVWRFNGTIGYVIDLRMETRAGDLDPFLSLISPINDVLVSNESRNGGADAGIQAFRLPYTGEYTIIARRSGAGAGRGGRTSGDYRLSLTLQGGASGLEGVLNPGTTLQGRLTEETPMATYRLEFGGTSTVVTDFGGANRLASLRILTPMGRLIAETRGLSPLALTTELTDVGPYVVEVASIRAEEATFVDFAVSAFRLNLGDRYARPLNLTAPRESVAQTVEYWFVAGKAGDLMTLDVTPATPAVDSVVRIADTGGRTLYESSLGAGIHQPITWREDGLYEVEILPGPGGVTYTIQVGRIGMNGRAFGLFRPVDDTSALNAAILTEGSLSIGGSDAHWIDASAGQVISLEAAPQASTDVIGVALQGPDGAYLSMEFSEGAHPALIERALLAQTGRYRVIVFEASGKTDTELPAVAYRLRYEDASGGLLNAGEVVKGVASAANGLALWSIQVPAEGLINVRLSNLTPLAWTPTLYIADPGGQIIAESTPDDANGGSEILLIGVPAQAGGLYRVIAGGRVVGNFASYNLQSDVLLPFSASSGETIQVNALQAPVSRYAPNPPAVPVPLQVNVSRLVNPLVSPQQLGGAGTLAFNNTARGEVAPGVLGQAWRFNVGANVVFQLAATALVGDVAPKLTLWDKAGTIVAEQFRADGVTTTLTYRTVNAATFDVVVGMGLDGGRYLLGLTAPTLSSGDIVVKAGRPLVYGETAYGEVLSADERDAYYFLGARGDEVDVQLTRLSGTLNPVLELRSPGDRAVPITGNGGRVRLPEDGVYTAQIRTLSQDERIFGRYALYLGLVGSARVRQRGGGIILPGTTRTGLLNLEDNQDVWLFSARRGERVTFTASAEGLLAPIGLRLMDTDGAVFAARESAVTGAVVQIVDVTLPADGIYRVQIIGAGNGAGIYRLVWHPEPVRPPTGALRYGQTVTGIFTPDRRAENWVFAATAGDVISVALRYVRGQPFNGVLQVRAENGVSLASIGDLGDGRGARADVLLPFSGIYSIVAGNPDGAYQGAGVYALSVNLQESRARSMGAILSYGESATGDVYPDDPDDTWVFSAQAGDRVKIAVHARDRFLKPALQVRTAQGEVLAAALPEVVAGLGQAASIGGQPDNPDGDLIIPADGIYGIVVNGTDGSAGSYLLTLGFTPPPVAEVNTIAYGQSRPGLIADDRAEEYYLFSGEQGDLIEASMTREPGATLSPIIRLIDETGATLAVADSHDADSATIRAFALPRTGSYRLVAARYLGADGQSAGRYTISLAGVARPRPIRGTIRYGQEAIGRLDDATPTDRLAFEGTAGDVVGVIARATSGDLDIAVQVTTETGEVIAFNDDYDGTDAFIGGVLLPADGRYILNLSRTGGRATGSAGNLSLLVNLLYRTQNITPVGAEVTYGTRVVGTVDVANPESRFTFRGMPSDVIRVQMAHQTDDAPPLLYIQDRAGTNLAEGRLAVGRTTIDAFPVPVEGFYTIVVVRPINTRLPYSPFALTVDLASAQLQGVSDGGLLETNVPAIAQFSPEQTGHYWLFAGTGGTRIALQAIGLSGDFSPALILIGADGEALQAVQASADTRAAAIGPITLPNDGLYSVLVLPDEARSAGSYRLSLSTDADLAQTETLVPGKTVSGLLNALKPAERWVFEGQAGQLVAARMLAAGGNLTPALRLVGADSVTLIEGSQEQTGDGLSSAISAFVLPSSGNYVLIATSADGIAPTAGIYRLLLEIQSPVGGISPQAVAAQPIAYGQAQSHLFTPGSPVYFGFVGAAGDVIDVAVRASNGAAPALLLQDSGGRTLFEAAPLASDALNPSETAIHAFSLPASGRYVIRLDVPTAGSYRLALQRRQDSLPANLETVPARVLVADTPLQNGITSDDLIDYWTFKGEPGELIQIEGRRLNGDLRLDLALYSPSGFLLSAVDDGRGEMTAGPILLPESGTYFLIAGRWLGSAGTTVGGYRLILSHPTPPESFGGGVIRVVGAPRVGLLTPDDDSDDWTFNGQAGEVLAFQAEALTGSPLFVLRLFEANGGEISLGEMRADGVLRARAALPASGVYTLRVAHDGDGNRLYRLSMVSLENPLQAAVEGAAGIAFGVPQTGLIDASTSARAWVFFGRGGERISAEAIPGAESALDPILYLLGPRGETLASDDNGGTGGAARLAGYLLPEDGFYALVVKSSPTSTAISGGKFVLSLERGFPGADYKGQIGVGEETIARLSLEQPAHEWAFVAGPDDLSIAATLETDSPVLAARLLLISPRGDVLAFSGASDEGRVVVESDLPGPGRYRVLVTGEGISAESLYRLRLANAFAPTGGGILRLNSRGYGQLGGEDFSDLWRLELDSTGQLNVTAARLSGNVPLEVTLFGLDGEPLASGSLPSGDPTAQSLEISAEIDQSGEILVLVGRSGGAGSAGSGSYVVNAALQPGQTTP